MEYENLNDDSWTSRKWSYIKSWWYYTGRYIITDFKEGIKNIWTWFPIIWKDRNWDHSYIFLILGHKLKLQSKYIANKNTFVNSKRNSEIMSTCISLIDKINKEFYCSEYHDYLNVKFWFEPIPNDNEYSELKSEIISENLDDYFKKYPLIYKRVLNGEGIIKLNDNDDKKSIAINIGNVNHKRAKKLLFKIIEENIEKWWD